MESLLPARRTAHYDWTDAKAFDSKLLARPERLEDGTELAATSNNQLELAHFDLLYLSAGKRQLIKSPQVFCRLKAL
jgi:hypothetical protein